MLTVSLVHGIVMPKTTSYALNDNIQLKYLGYFHDISLYLGISLIISRISSDMNRLSTTIACNVTRGFCESVFVLELWLAHLDARLGLL